MTDVKTKVTSLIEMMSNLPKYKNNIPLKKAFNPMALPNLLPGLLLGKMQDFGSVIILLSGEGLNEIYSTSLKGIDIFDVLSSQEKEFVIKIHKNMFEHACGVFTVRQLEKETGIVMTLGTYSFPMVSDNGKERYFLMYYEDLSAKIEHYEFQGKLSALSHYSSVEFLNIGNGIPSETDFTAELAALSLAG